ncbi:MAG: sensor histidine kinase [Ignavibacteriae bacterium]|nr:sensor histidine kinase [Ignavibacteriota bacterium]
MHQKLTELLETIKKRPFSIVIISIAFGIVGAFIDAVIDYLFFYEEELLEVFIPNISSHEFYMRVMLIFTLTSFSFLIVFLLKRINKYENQLKTINEHLEEMVIQRTKEFGDLFSQSPFAKALLNKNFEISETNLSWNKYFNFDKSIMTGSNLFDNKYFANLGLENNFLSVRNEIKPFESESIYIEELDKILTLNIYPITNNQNDVEKIVCNLEDITDRIKRYESDKELEINKISMKTIFDILETERARLANELHDEIGQKLMISKLHLELLKKECNIIPEKFDEIIKYLQNTNADIKNIVYALYPPELKKYGLVEAIRSRINNCSKIGNYNLDFRINGNYTQLKKEIELGIYRIFQEAFSNITKHAKANSVKSSITFFEKQILCVIQDDGIGFNLEQTFGESKKYGLISMSERAKILGGNLEIETSLHNGTKIFIELPRIEKSNEQN